MNIKELVQITSALKNEATVVKNEEGEVIRPNEYTCFAVIRKTKAKRDKSLDKVSDEDLMILSGPLKLNESSSSVLRYDEYYLVPLYSDITEYRYLALKNKEELILSKEPLFTLNGAILRDDNNITWSDYPCDIINSALLVLNSEYRCVSGLTLNFKSDENLTLKQLVQYFEFIKGFRIKFSNTLTNNEYRRLGDNEYKKMKEANNDEATIKLILHDYDLISKNMAGIKRISDKNYKGTPIIPNYAKYQLIDMYKKILQIETTCKKLIADEVHKKDIWTHWLEGISGCGELTAAYMIAYLNPRMCRHPSGFIRYCGLDVVRDKDLNRDVGRNMKYKRRTIYIAKNGDPEINETCGYNPIMKTRIAGIFVPAAIKSGKGYYRDQYYHFKEYYANRPDLKEWFADKSNTASPHKMAIRKVASNFLIDFWLRYRELLGLPLNGGTYAEEKLGIKHGYDRRPPLFNPPEKKRVGRPKKSAQTVEQIEL